MKRYLVFRVGQSIIALIGVSVLAFFLAAVSPDDLLDRIPTGVPPDFELLVKAWGLDKPIVVQYGLYMKDVLQGDWGESWKWGSGALEIVLEKFPATLQLAAFTLVISTVLGISIGMLAAAKKDAPFDWGGKIVALLGQSLSSFWLGIVLMWVFAVLFGWLPTSGRGGIAHMIMPAIALGWFNMAALMRLTRSAMLEALDSEYVKLARIKGLPEWKVIWKHCLRNAAIAPLTYFGLAAGFLLTGLLVTEMVFAWPGAGLLALEAVQARDDKVAQAVVLFMASIFIVYNLVLDTLYAYLDPRIRYS